ncbi:beta-ketoacyl-ACP synthase II [Clostridium sp. HCP1S3_B4]|uniref:beta-ketoacyl-ACP synthase II n=1 Tax=unclassified Clostridium TaxID=2614128 RepID=UPI002A7C3198|nr:beta-ketoacyl-ACP synthase II [Clostridiales bacterium]MDY2729905.1 beta-ketoacyl-ACP synthase II [Clostridium sp.]
MNRVVITGIGVVSPVGNNLNDFWNNIKEGKHGIDLITRFDTTDFPVKVAAEVKDFNPLLSMDKKEVKRTDLYSQYALEAARQAVEDCNCDLNKYYNPYEIGVIVGSGTGGISSLEEGHERFIKRGPRAVSPFMIPMMISNMASGNIAIKHGFKGMNYGIVSACATSCHTIGEAYSAIKTGRLKACLAGGTEASITPFTIAGFNNMKTLTNTDDKDRASIPFDKDRSGFVMGEGSGVIVLENLESALKRNAKIYAEVVGYGATADAYHITSPDPEGEAAAYAMEMAVKEAEIPMDAVDYVNAHGTSTPLNDKYETNAIKRAFKEHSKDLYVSSTKSMTGHLLGAAGVMASIICAMSLKDGFVPMTVGYKNPDEECDLNYVTEKGIEKNIEYAIANSLGFGGHNATLCFKKYNK